MSLFRTLTVFAAVAGSTLSAILDSLRVTAVGMALIFLVLALVWLAVLGLRRFRPPAPPRAVSVPSSPPPAKADEEEELAAVFAAVLAAIRPPPAPAARVKVIRRLSDDTTAWARAGRWERIRERSGFFERSTGAS